MNSFNGACLEDFHMLCYVVFRYNQEQKRRYIEIKQSDLPMSVAAKRTREFRCPPQEQVSSHALFVLKAIFIFLF